MTTAYGAGGAARKAIRTGLFAGDLGRLPELRLAGSRCAACAETTLGEVSACPNCGSKDVTTIPLSNRGVLWSFTVVRHRPPGEYRGHDPFVPFALALVELSEGIRVMTPVLGDPASLSIGDELIFRPFVRPDAGAEETVVYAFEKRSGEASNV